MCVLELPALRRTDVRNPADEEDGDWQLRNVGRSDPSREFFGRASAEFNSGRRSKDAPMTALQGGKVMKTLFRRLWQEEEGQDLVEYALLVVLIALGAIAAMKSLANAISDAFSNAGANLTSAAST
jgi:pilus assembly protein Flp/PilA